MKFLEKIKTHIKILFSGYKNFNRNEISGSFGDIGTTLPLIIGIINNCGLNSASIFIMFGLMQILTGVIYGIPMSVQPLKAMTIIMISQKLSPNILFGAGLSIAITMLILSITGVLEKFINFIPKCVIRGIQLALGLSLANLAIKDYIPSEGIYGYFLALLTLFLILFFLGNKKYPPALFVLTICIIYTVLMRVNYFKIVNNIGLSFPETYLPSINDIIQGFLILALPQIPLSVSNSIAATKQTIKDLFPNKEINAKKIGLTYSIMNLINPFFCGIPTCHGAGGITGYYAFGGRTGYSVIFTGTMYLALGLFFSKGFGEIIKVFPLPVLGVILIIESISLMLLSRDIMNSKKDIFIAFIVAIIGFSCPNGYLVGLIIGIVISYLMSKKLILNFYS